MSSMRIKRKFGNTRAFCGITGPARAIAAPARNPRRVHALIDTLPLIYNSPFAMEEGSVGRQNSFGRSEDVILSLRHVRPDCLVCWVTTEAITKPDFGCSLARRQMN